MILTDASTLHVTDQAEIQVKGNTAVSTWGGIVGGIGGAGIAIHNKAVAVFDSVDSVDPTKVMVDISDNKALRGKGGGIAVSTGTSVVLTSKHVFDNNFATSGGALGFANVLPVDMGGGNCVRVVVQTSNIEIKNSKSLEISTSPVSALSHPANTILKQDENTGEMTGGKYKLCSSLI